jgi:hypothetical protein
MYYEIIGTRGFFYLFFTHFMTQLTTQTIPLLEALDNQSFTEWRDFWNKQYPEGKVLTIEDFI